MNQARDTTRVYHVGPWRRAVPWLIFGPFMLLAAGILIFVPDPESRALAILLLVLFSVLALAIHVMIWWARLELNTDGIRLRQIGMNLTTPWPNVLGLRLARGRQGIVTREPMAGSGAANLAAVRGLRFYGSSYYNDEQCAAMGERRWIPIEAFAWHLKHGPLLEELRSFAPAIEVLADPPAAPPQTPAQRRRAWLIFGGILTLAFAGIVILGLGPPSWAEHTFAILFALLAPLLTLGSAISALNAFRAGGRFMGVTFAFAALLGLAWCLVSWSDVIVVFGGGG